MFNLYLNFKNIGPASRGLKRAIANSAPFRKGLPTHAGGQGDLKGNKFYGALHILAP